MTAVKDSMGLTLDRIIKHFGGFRKMKGYPIYFQVHVRE